MQSYPLSELIRNRSFDRFQDGLEARFLTYRIKYQLTYCEPTDNSALRIDFEYKNKAGRMTVWEAGECNLEVLDIETEKIILWKDYQLDNEKEFHLLLAQFFLYFRDGKNLPSQ